MFVILQNFLLPLIPQEHELLAALRQGCNCAQLSMHTHGGKCSLCVSPKTERNKECSYSMWYSKLVDIYK